MAAAWGAAAEVPKKGRKPGVFVETPSAAAKSGFCKVWPPAVPKRKLPEVIGVPSGWKNILRGPSELKVSIGLVAPPVNGCAPFPALFQYTAATLTVFRPAL